MVLLSLLLLVVQPPLVYHSRWYVVSELIVWWLVATAGVPQQGTVVLKWGTTAGVRVDCANYSCARRMRMRTAVCNVVFS